MKRILEQPHTANQQPAARGGASVVAEPSPQAPPAPVHASKPPLADPAVSQDASVLCNRKRTIPNILSHSRKLCLTGHAPLVKGRPAHIGSHPQVCLN